MYFTSEGNLRMWFLQLIKPALAWLTASLIDVYLMGTYIYRDWL